MKTFGVAIVAVTLGSGCATQSGSDSGKAVAFYRVGLVCPAAPKIGCGSAAKPLLLELEKAPEIEQAWLNREGTLIAVTGETGATGKRLEREAGRVFKAYDIEAEKVAADERGRIEASFSARTGWLRGAGVDELSIEEAQLITERVLRRVDAKTPLAEKDKAVLRDEFRRLIEGRFLRNAGPSTREEWEQKALEVARPLLGSEQLAALKEALAAGFRPRAGEE